MKEYATHLKQMPRLARYFRFLADHMRLRDWTFDVEFDPTLNCSLATVSCIQNRRHAVLAVGPLFFDSSPEDQRHGAVHELVHCHLQPARTFFATLGAPHGDAHGVLQQNHENHLESATDDIAAAIAAGQPTFDKFDTSKAKR